MAHVSAARNHVTRFFGFLTCATYAVTCIPALQFKEGCTTTPLLLCLGTRARTHTHIHTYTHTHTTHTTHTQPTQHTFFNEHCVLNQTIAQAVVGTADRNIIIYDLTKPQQPFKQLPSPLKWQTRAVTCFPDKAGFLLGSIEGRVAVQHVDDAQATK